MIDADTIHAGILLIGLWFGIEVAFRENWTLLFTLCILTLWTLGYYGFVKMALPARLSGQ